MHLLLLLAFIECTFHLELAVLSDLISFYHYISVLNVSQKSKELRFFEFGILVILHQINDIGSRILNHFLFYFFLKFLFFFFSVNILHFHLVIKLLNHLFHFVFFLVFLKDLIHLLLLIMSNLLLNHLFIHPLLLHLLLKDHLLLMIEFLFFTKGCIHLLEVHLSLLNLVIFQSLVLILLNIHIDRLMSLDHLFSLTISYQCLIHELSELIGLSRLALLAICIASSSLE